MKGTLSVIIMAFMLIFSLGIISSTSGEIYTTDNYSIKDSTSIVPESGTITNIITALSALGVFFVVRRSN